MSPNRKDLETLQARMLDALHTARSPRAALRALLADAALQPFHAWLRSVDAASWEVAMEVVKRYARPSGPLRASGRRRGTS